jgi:beta-lactamase class D
MKPTVSDMASQYTRAVWHPPELAAAVVRSNANAILDRLRRCLLPIIVGVAFVVHAQERAPQTASPQRGSAVSECFMFARLDGSDLLASNPRECDYATAPASTFKIPHALIALETGVIDERTVVRWDGTAYEFESWRRDHTLESAIRSSVYPFFRRTAALIGAERMHRMLKTLQYGADTFEGDVREFWTNGDLVVTPREQLSFLRRMFSGALPIAARHVQTVSSDLVMPPLQISNASGLHVFLLRWPSGTIVRAKTGNTTVAGERVSWLVGSLESVKGSFVFVGRVRARSEMTGTAGADLALRELNRQVKRVFVGQ